MWLKSSQSWGQCAWCQCNFTKSWGQCSQCRYQIPDLEAPSGKLKLITFKKPKADLSGPKVKTPEIDLNTEAPDLSLSAPTVDADVKVPDADINLPKADLTSVLPKESWNSQHLKSLTCLVQSEISWYWHWCWCKWTRSESIWHLRVGNSWSWCESTKSWGCCQCPHSRCWHQCAQRKAKIPNTQKFNLSSPKVKSPDVDIAAHVMDQTLTYLLLRLILLILMWVLPKAGVDIDVPTSRCWHQCSQRKI